MTLDYNSLLVALSVSGACLAVTLFANWAMSRQERFLLTWSRGVALIVAYALAYTGYVAAPSWWLGSICFLILFAGFTMLLVAAHQFVGQDGRPSRAFVLGMGLLGTASLGAMAAGYDGLGLIGENLWATIALAAIAGVYWRARAEAPTPIATLSALYLLNTVGFLLCAAILLFEGRLVLGHAPQNWAENLCVGISIATMTGIGALSMALNHWRAARRSHEDARTDSMTGLLNRRALFESFADRSVGPYTAVLMFDLDRFKPINDTYGHAVGDEVIRTFARILSGVCEQGCSVARIGGEEFVVVVERTTREGARLLAEAIRTRFQSTHIPRDNGTLLTTTVSAGIAFGADPPIGFEKVLGAADRALYEAKSQGRNTVEVEPLRLVG
jgi:diguanylate cyclase (GGDEF)-like protein